MHTLAIPAITNLEADSAWYDWLLAALARGMEPRQCEPSGRLGALEELVKARRATDADCRESK